MSPLVTPCNPCIPMTENLKIDREKTMFDVLYRRQAFLKNENVGVKKQKIGILPKGLVHGAGQKC